MDLGRLQPVWKLWIEKDGEYVFGAGTFKLLRAVQTTGSIAKSAESLGMSYRYAWGLIRNVEARLGTRVVETHRGGSTTGGLTGGGGARVTEAGIALMELYARVSEAFEKAMDNLS
ncbi:MAG: LysR family transcriptional regulator [Candidatus Thorarchaeota archaeon]|nr:LysR family transcriptional regulator [Candidatus Thorarchaeota archaeon]